jgi:hypothetical protein
MHPGYSKKSIFSSSHILLLTISMASIVAIRILSLTSVSTAHAQATNQIPNWAVKVVCFYLLGSVHKSCV